MFKKTGGGFLFVALLLIGCFFVLSDAFDGEDGVFKLPLGIDLQGGTELLYGLDLSVIPGEMRRDMAENVKTVLLRRLDAYGTSERTISVVGRDEILIELPGFDRQEIEIIEGAIGESGELTFNLKAIPQHQTLERVADIERQMAEHRRATEAFASDSSNPKPEPLPQLVVLDDTQSVKDGQQEIPDNLKAKIVVDSAPGQFVSGKYLKAAYRTQDDNGLPAIGFEFTGPGRQQFAEITSENINRQLAVVLDGRMISAPNINSRIAGRGIIEGSFTDAEIKGIVSILSAGSLPAKPFQINKTTIGSVLGRDSIAQGQAAMLVSFVLVIIMMAGIYLAPGIVANLALILNLVILLALMIVFRNTLTFPGLAGLLLTVGMSVDANILIFERIREEKARGKSLNQSVQSGYQRAFWTIFDANLTTLITAFILFHFGTGPVKGFAVVLSLGIVVSFFTALFVSRLFLSFLMKRKMITELRMIQVLRTPNIDFLKIRKPAAFISVGIIILGITTFVVRGNENMGIDFTGGKRLVINLKTPVDSEDDIRQRIISIKDEAGKVLFQDVQVQSVGVSSGRAGGAEGISAVSVRIRIEGSEPTTAEASDPNPAGSEESRPANKARTFQQRVEGVLGDLIAPNGIISSSAPSADDPSQNVLTLQVYLNKDGVTLSDELKTALTNGGFGFTSVTPITDKGLGEQYVGYEVTSLPYTPTPPPADDLAGMVLRNQFEGIFKVAPFVLSEPFPKVDTITAKVANDLKAKMFTAMFIAILAIVFYVSLRFQFKFGLAAIVALVHDLLFVLGVLAIADMLFGDFFSLKINLPVVAALLTVVGYSLNDTIVIFDRIRENIAERKRGFDYLGAVNTSINQTLSRTLLTSATTFAVVAILLVWGGESITAFAFALCVGVVVGTFSSIYVATPALIYFNDRADKRREQLLKEAGRK